jgi:lysophospholipase L1-like esterase
MFTHVPAAARADFYLKDGDRVVFYGDSITEQRLYTTYVEEFVLTRFPRMNVTFVHSGVGGDKVSGGWAGPVEVRLRRDVFDYKPTVVTVMLGMNDGEYRPFDAAVFERYSTGYRDLVRSVKHALPDARLTLIQPSPYDEVTRTVQIAGGYNNVLRRFGEYVADLGRREGATVADMNTPVTAALEKANSAEACTARMIIPDRIHPGPAGHWMMALALLKAWNAPSIVTSVEIDGGGARVVRSENTTVSELSGGEGGLTWTQLDAALPLPLDLQDATVDLAARASDLIGALDQQPLRVTGLPPGRYRLTIDKTEVGDFSERELSGGVNLALRRTPMFWQALGVHWATMDRNQAQSMRFKLLVDKAEVPSFEGALAALTAMEAKAVRLQHERARPVPHRYELRPVRE